MTRQHMNRSLRRQAAMIKKLREELRIERGLATALGKMNFASVKEQKRSHLRSLRRWTKMKEALS